MKIKNFTALLCMLFVAQLSFGQITLEHEYNDLLGTINEKITDISAFKYYISDYKSGEFTIYNLDHSVYKTINVEMPSGTSISSMGQLYTNVINTDQLVELYYVLKSKDSKDNDLYNIYLINENKELIKKFENMDYLRVINTNEGTKLVTTYSYYEEGYYKSKSKVYSLPTTPDNIPSLQSESRSLPYPNPAKQTITIPYQLSGQWGTISIYNASGQFVEQKNVDKNFSNLLLDVSGYAKGMYYYKVDKQKGEFMVN